jgi:hypothetical protein
VDGTSATGDITGVIRDSLITGSTNGDGIMALANPATPPPGGIKPMVTVSLDHTDVAGNHTGVTSFTGAAVILNNSTIQTNGFGLNAANGGVIFSFGNNAINSNQPNGDGTAPIVIGLH